jgi:hypothetical protein
MTPPRLANHESPGSPKARATVGCILGTAVGDAMGLVCEGLSRRRQLKMFPELSGYRLLPWGKGICSDDTEHTCMLAQSLIANMDCPEDELPRRFAASFAWRLRFWLWDFPPASGWQHCARYSSSGSGCRRAGAACSQRETRRRCAAR